MDIIVRLCHNKFAYLRSKLDTRPSKLELGGQRPGLVPSNHLDEGLDLGQDGH